MFKEIFNAILELVKHIGVLPTLLVVLNCAEVFAIWKLWLDNKAKDDRYHKAEVENLKIFTQMNTILDKNIQKSGHDQEMVKQRLDNLKDLLNVLINRNG